MATQNKVGEQRGMTRRDVLQSMGLAGLALGTGTLAGMPARATALGSSSIAAETPGMNGQYNVLFILTDQKLIPTVIQFSIKIFFWIIP